MFIASIVSFHYSVFFGGKGGSGHNCELLSMVDFMGLKKIRKNCGRPT